MKRYSMIGTIVLMSMMTISAQEQKSKVPVYKQETVTDSLNRFKKIIPANDQDFNAFIKSFITDANTLILGAVASDAKLLPKIKVLTIINTELGELLKKIRLKLPVFEVVRKFYQEKRSVVEKVKQEINKMPRTSVNIIVEGWIHNLLNDINALPLLVESQKQQTVHDSFDRFKKMMDSSKEAFNAFVKSSIDSANESIIKSTVYEQGLFPQIQLLANVNTEMGQLLREWHNAIHEKPYQGQLAVFDKMLQFYRDKKPIVQKVQQEINRMPQKSSTIMVAEVWVYNLLNDINALPLLIKDAYQVKIRNLLIADNNALSHLLGVNLAWPTYKMMGFAFLPANTMVATSAMHQHIAVWKELVDAWKSNMLQSPDELLTNWLMKHKVDLEPAQRLKLIQQLNAMVDADKRSLAQWMESVEENQNQDQREKLIQGLYAIAVPTEKSVNKLLPYGTRLNVAQLIQKLKETKAYHYKVMIENLFEAIYKKLVVEMEIK